MLAKWIDFKTHTDGRGSLVAIEAKIDIPFDIKRAYYICVGSGEQPRSSYAHKALKQLCICISGSCYIKLDNGESSEMVILDNPNQGLLIDTFMWREISNFTPNTVLLSIESDMYDESEYIQSYDDFIKYLRWGTPYISNGSFKPYVNQIEITEIIPFDIKRIFYVFGTDADTIRGQHANVNSEFLMISVSGSCNVKVIHPNGSQNTFCLDTPEKHFYIPKMTWKDMYNFSQDCVLLVLASTHYDKGEYIYNLDSFLKFKK